VSTDRGDQIVKWIGLEPVRQRDVDALERLHREDDAVTEAEIAKVNPSNPTTFIRAWHFGEAGVRAIRVRDRLATALLDRANVKAFAGPATRPRGHRSARRTATGSRRRVAAAARQADDSDLPHAVACPGCDADFLPRRPNQTHCKPACRKRAARARAAAMPDLVPEHEPAVIDLIRANEMEPWAGLFYTVFPEGLRRRHLRAEVPMMKLPPSVLVAA
jgi:hypothetical protein